MIRSFIPSMSLVAVAAFVASCGTEPKTAVDAPSSNRDAMAQSDLSDFNVSMVTGGGFTGARHGYEIAGDGTLQSLYNFPGNEWEKHAVGTVDAAALQHLAAKLVEVGFFAGQGAEGPGDNMMTDFTATYQGVTRSVSWGAFGGAPIWLNDAVKLFKASTFCEGEGSQATCNDDYSCQEGRCEQRPVSMPPMPGRSLTNFDCFCPEVYAPVCGVDGQTYGNRCEARCAGTGIAHSGECVDVRPPVVNPPVDSGCFCAEVYLPVCGVNGQTYSNSCKASCAGVEVAHSGQCVDVRPPVVNPPGNWGCICTKEYAPVCGVNGRTYGNRCEARCGNTEIAYSGECREAAPAPGDCICPAHVDPVCGEDGQTYTNSCRASCAGTEVAYGGECRGEL